jgi:hypothetical protein
MRLQEVLEISGVPLEEATLTQIIKRVQKHKADSRNEDELGRALSGDGALADSVGAVTDATEQERKAYAELIKDPMVAAAIDKTPSAMKSQFAQLEKVGEEAPETEEEPSKKPADSNALKALDPKMKAKLAAMQKEWFARKTPQQKQALVDAWVKDPVTSRVYRFGLKQGIFVAPKAA